MYEVPLYSFMVFIIHVLFIHKLNCVHQLIIHINITHRIRYQIDLTAHAHDIREYDAIAYGIWYGNKDRPLPIVYGWVRDDFFKTPPMLFKSLPHDCKFNIFTEGSLKSTKSLQRIVPAFDASNKKLSLWGIVIYNFKLIT